MSVGETLTTAHKTAITSLAVTSATVTMDILWIVMTVISAMVQMYTSTCIKI